MAATKMSETEISTELGKLPGWSVAQGKLHRVFEFADFRQAFSFMTAVALAAEAMNHHHGRITLLPPFGSCNFYYKFFSVRKIDKAL